MTTYAIGDLQGCLTPLRRLLDKLAFDPADDTLWFVGDLVNRGPESLECLRFVQSLGDRAITVLGNHDLHLLAVIHGVRDPHPKDTLDDILNADDLDALVHWLRHLPLLHQDSALGRTLVHAGVHPAWDTTVAQEEADAVHSALRSDDYAGFLLEMYGNKPARWRPDRTGVKRLRFAVNVFTRMRYLHPDGALELSANGPPADTPAPLVPWYSLPGSWSTHKRIVFGHWSSHPAMAPPHVLPLDRGCVWGGSLVACALETGQHFSVGCD